jgi:hypothetical protein
MGGGGDDALYGDFNSPVDGDDTVTGGSGADTLDGGGGNDTSSYVGPAAGVLVSLYHDLAGGGDAEGDELNNIENITGSSHHDDLWGDDERLITERSRRSSRWWAPLSSMLQTTCSSNGDDPCSRSTPLREFAQPQVAASREWLAPR